MDDPGRAGLILVLFLVIEFLTCAFCAALYSVRPDDEEEVLKKKNNDRLRNNVMNMLSVKHTYLYAAVSIVTVSDMIIGTVFGRWLYFKFQNIIFGDISGGSFPASKYISAVLSFLIIMLLILIAGYQIPVSLAKRNPSKWLRVLSGPLRILTILLTPLIAAATSVSKGILFLLGVKKQEIIEDVTEEEIRSMVEEGHEHGVIDRTEAEMITNIFEFSEKEAQDIMTHRKDIVAIEDTETLSDTITFMLSKRFSRFPIYHENIDQIVGTVHLRDVVKFRERHPEKEDDPLSRLRSVIRKPLYVPETKNIDVLFQQMQKEKTQMVIVIDEYGQTSGLVAMEDILEEIVGNILDEYDVVENHIFPTNNKNEFIVDGRTPLEELTARFGLTFDDLPFDDLPFETVNGFMVFQMERVPDPNDRTVIKYKGYTFRILTVEDRCIQRLMLTKSPENFSEAGQ